MSRPVDALIDFLQKQEAQGHSHIYLDEGAREGLRELYKRARQPSPAPPAAATEPAPPPPATLTPTGSTKIDKLRSIRTQAATWPPALSLGTLRETLVFATGDPDAEIMLIGEAPGYHEEKEQEPFVGPAGKKLDDILKAMGIRREQVYISTLVKFRPSMPRQTTNNRKPSPAEMAACLPLVMAEISIIQPKLILALGSTTAEGLLGLEGSIDSMRGTWHDFSGIPARVTYHPSYLLQAGGSNQAKRLLWEDMLATMQQLGMPISEKQQSYFLPKP